jgi:hypothetical protein
MNLAVPVKDSPGPLPLQQPVRRSRRPLIVFALVFALLGGGGWYYFFGRKPKVAMTVALELNGNVAARGLWSAGPGEVLLVADGDVQLIDLVARKKKWTAVIPKPAATDAAVQESLSARFAGLQAWSEDLSRRRGSISGEEAIKAFNEEAARYHEELTAVRAEAAKAVPKPGIAPASTSAPTPAPEKPPVRLPDAADVFGGDRSNVDRLHPIEDMRVKLLTERIQKREAKLASLWTTAVLKKNRAITAVQKTAAADAEARYDVELAEQKRDEEALARLNPDEPKAVAPAKSVDVDDGPPSFLDERSDGRPKVAMSGDRIWVGAGRHAVAFDRGSGAVKADVPLAGPVRRIFADGTGAIIIASTSAGAVQVTKMAWGAQPQSAYFPTGRRESAFTYSGLARMPNVQDLRTEFSAVGGSLLRVDIRLKEKNVVARDAIKPGSEKELEAAAGGAAAHSVDEMKSIVALLRNDSARLTGANIEHVDDSTY